MLLSSELKKYKFSSMQCVYQEIDWGVGGDFLHMERVKQATRAGSLESSGSHFNLEKMKFCIPNVM
jgi:hypothetical protein